MEDELKIGAAISAANKEKIQAAHDAMAALGAACRSEMDVVQKTIDPADVFTFYGAEVKALGDGKIGGYLVRFSTPDDPDLVGDFFTDQTDFGPHTSTPVMYQHGMDVKMQRRVIGSGNITKDKIGMWLDAQLEMRDDYEKAIYEMAQAGKLGWSSGTAGHLVQREPSGKAQFIKSWPLGLDASLTPTPAEPRNVAQSLKSLIEITPTQTAEPVTVVENNSVTGENKMDPELEALKTELASLKATIEAAPAVKKAPAYNKAPLGDDAFKAFGNWARTGDYSGMTPAVKAVDWQEGTATEGGVVVPDEVYLQIAKKRDDLSVMRASGARVFKTTSKKVIFPAESAREAAFVSTAEEATYDQGNTTPLAAVDITPVKYTRMTKVSEELLADDKNDIVGFLMSRYARAIASAENTAFMTGAGDGDPAIQGIFVGGTAAKTFVAATPTAAEIVALNYLLPSAYTDGSAWYMRYATLGLLMGLASSSVFTFQQTPAGAPGFPGMPYLMGAPVYVADGVAAAALSAKSVMRANPEFYQIVDNGTMIVNRNPYLYMLNGQTAFFASVRIGGAVLQAEAFQYGTSATA